MGHKPVTREQVLKAGTRMRLNVQVEFSTGKFTLS